LRVPGLPSRSVFILCSLLLGSVAPSVARADTGPTPAGPTPEGRIAFVRNGHSLRTTAPDGTDRRSVWRSPLSARRSTVYGPSWSPNGRRIAFGVVRWNTGGARILSVLEDGSRLRRVALGSFPSWSPDGDRIALSRQGQVWTVRPDGSDERQLTSLPPDARIGSLVWSPGADAVVFTNGTDLWSVGADGGDAHLLLASARNPSFMPDGRLLSITDVVLCEGCECGSVVVPALQVSEADGSDVSKWWIPGAHDGILRTSPSPDGTALALEYPVEYGSSSCEDFFAPSSAVANVDGSGFLPLGPTEYPVPYLTDPAWSPA
jgi:hypothetical protein